MYYLKYCFAKPFSISTCNNRLSLPTKYLIINQSCAHILCIILISLIITLWAFPTYFPDQFEWHHLICHIGFIHWLSFPLARVTSCHSNRIVMSSINLPLHLPFCLVLHVPFFLFVSSPVNSISISLMFSSFCFVVLSLPVHFLSSIFVFFPSFSVFPNFLSVMLFFPHSPFLCSTFLSKSSWLTNSIRAVKFEIRTNQENR